MTNDSCSCNTNKSKKCKAYSVVIELELQRVTCPGVWLCNNGKVTVQIFILGLCTQTSAMNPVFPLSCNEKFVFRKNFSSIQNLIDIDRKLDKEIIYLELIQWEDCMNGNVLATFKTTLNDLLYPFPCYKGVVAGVDVDLLMEATRVFPGILAPKIEVSTKLVIEEVLCSLRQEKQNDVLVINPKLISSKCVPKRCIPVHQRRVCHNNKYHMAKSPPQKPCKKYDRPVRNSQGQKKLCSCEGSINKKQPEKGCQRQVSFCNPEPPKMQCVKLNSKVSCGLCTKYTTYFTKDEKKCNCCISEPNTCIENGVVDEPATVKQFKVCGCNKVTKPTNPDNENDANFCGCVDNQIKATCACKMSDELKKCKSSDQISPDLPRSSSIPDYLTSNKNPTSCDTSCNKTFYKNLETFYKQLYLRAHYKLKNELCRCANEKN